MPILGKCNAEIAELLCIVPVTTPHARDKVRTNALMIPADGNSTGIA
jgi:hypothetical protein